jgi:hypothetical protein
MSDSPIQNEASVEANREEFMSALFANMIVQQTNLAMMLLGKAPHPETGQHIRDLEGAKMFIDQLEMLEVKTKGNLEKQEQALLKQSLTMLRLAFVEAVNAPPDQAAPTKDSRATAPAADTAADATPSAAPSPSATTSVEASRTKFSKKY